MDDYSYPSTRPALASARDHQEYGAVERYRDVISYGTGSGSSPAPGQVREVESTRIDGSHNEVTKRVSYEYDTMNRLTLATNRDYTNPGGDLVRTDDSAYDLLGRRVSQNIELNDLSTNLDDPTYSINYFYAGEETTPLSESNEDPLQPDNRWMVQDARGFSLGEMRDLNSRYTLTDHLGSVESVVYGESGNSAPGVVGASYDYDTFGSNWATDFRSYTTTGEYARTVYQFTGQRYSPVAETTQHGAIREYSATAKSWLQTDQYLDPYEDLGLSVDPETRMRSVYAGYNPVNFIDTNGHGRTVDGCGAGGHNPQVCKNQNHSSSGGGGGSDSDSSNNSDSSGGGSSGGTCCYTSYSSWTASTWASYVNPVPSKSSTSFMGLSLIGHTKVDGGGGFTGLAGTLMDGARRKTRSGAKNGLDGIASVGYGFYYGARQYNRRIGQHLGPLSSSARVAIAVQKTGLAIDNGAGWIEHKWVDKGDPGWYDEGFAKSNYHVFPSIPALGYNSRFENVKNYNGDYSLPGSRLDKNGDGFQDICGGGGFASSGAGCN